MQNSKIGSVKSDIYRKPLFYMPTLVYLPKYKHYNE